MLLRSTPARRRASLAIASAALLPALSACGFNYATDRDYTPSVGANNRSGPVDVLGGVIVSAEPDKGVFIASFNNGTDEPVQVTSVKGADPARVADAKVSDVEIAPHALVNLANVETPIELTGSFEAGQFAEMLVTFSDGNTVDIHVPVVRNCGYYAEIPGLMNGAPTCPVETAADR